MGWLDRLLGREKRGGGEPGSAGMGQRPQEQSGGGQTPTPQEPREPQAPEESEQDRI